MKKILVSVLAVASLAGCGVPLETKDKTYPTVGLFNPEDKSDKVCYEVSVGNVVWSILLA